MLALAPAPFKMGAPTACLMRVIIACSLVAVALLAGCIAYPCTQGPLVSARAVSPTAPTAGGPGDATLQVFAKDPAGNAIADAGIALYWATATPSDVRDEGARAEAGPEGAQVSVGRSAGTVQARTVLSLRTSDVGVATANVPSNMILGLVAAHESSTEEWIGYFASPSDGEVGQIAITLYPSQLEWTVNATLSPAALSAAFLIGDSHYWLPQQLPIEGDGSSHMDRLVELEAFANWTNGMTGFGDLGIGVGDASELRLIGDDSENFALSSQSEHVQASDDKIREYGFADSSGLQAGPVSKSSFVAPFGLPAQIQVRAHFDRARADVDNCLYVFSGDGNRDASDGSGSSDTIVIPQEASYARVSPAAGIVFGFALLGLAAVVRRRAQF